MSETGKNNNNGQNGTKGQNPDKKPNLIVRAWRCGKRIVLKFSNDHPIATKVTKGLVGLGTVGYGGYKMYKRGFKDGANSVVPTTVYIQSGCNDDDPQDEEDNLEEETEEPVEETTEV